MTKILCFACAYLRARKHKQVKKYCIYLFICYNILRDYLRKVGDKFMSNHEKKFDVTFTMVNEQEATLIINAIKRQVDYYRNRVFNQFNVLSESQLNWSKHNYSIYNDLYNKIIHDYNNVVKVNA